MPVRFLAGLPRSGSTLLADLLHSHPDVHVSGTSTLGGCVEAAATVLSNSDGVQSDMANDLGMLDRYRAALRGLIAGWYADVDEPCVVDKGRGWPSLWPLVLDLDPDARMLVTVRDPRDVIASIERAHRATATFHAPSGRTLADSTATLMGPQGLVGGHIRFVEDLIQRQLPGITYVPYTRLTADHHSVLAGIAKALDLAEHDWPDEAVERGLDNDGVWRGKFPHRSAGPVRPDTGSWQEMIDEQTAANIAVSYPLYMRTFGYQETSP